LLTTTAIATTTISITTAITTGATITAVTITTTNNTNTHPRIRRINGESIRDRYSNRVKQQFPKTCLLNSTYISFGTYGTWRFEEMVGCLSILQYERQE
jgi:hypothetical protein